MASYSGRRYGSTFCVRSPGRNPSFSPASTAGRVRMIRSTSLFFSAITASAIARYVLPVPAGPIANVSMFCRMAFTYCCCPIVLQVICFPRWVTAITFLNVSSICSFLPSRIMAITYRIRTRSTYSCRRIMLSSVSITCSGRSRRSSSPWITSLFPLSAVVTPHSCSISAIFWSFRPNRDTYASMESADRIISRLVINPYDFPSPKLPLYDTIFTAFVK